MSRSRFLDAIRLRPVDRLPCSEWIDHPMYVHRLTGIDPFEEPRKAIAECIRRLDIDWYVGLPRHAHRFQPGESRKDLGSDHYVTEWGFTGSGWNTGKGSGFSCDEDVYGYDPREVSSREDREREYKAGLSEIEEDQALVGDACYISGLYYTTLFQWFILTFGWERFLTAAVSDPEAFKRTIARYAELSIEYAEFFARSDLPVFFCHDDLAMTRGLVFPPEWYRRNIIPWYEGIFDPIRKAKKKVIFVSDGDYSALVDDLVAVGVDGLMFDHFVNIEAILHRHGGTMLIAGNVDIRTLTFGAPADVRREVERCRMYARRYPGYVIKVSGDLPHNIPLENIDAYFLACRELGLLEESQKSLRSPIGVSDAWP